MNPKIEREHGYYGCMYFERKKKYTFEDMQNDMQKLNSDIAALESIDIDEEIKFLALVCLNSKKEKLLKDMHEELDAMYS